MLLAPGIADASCMCVGSDSSLTRAVYLEGETRPTPLGPNALKAFLGGQPVWALVPHFGGLEQGVRAGDGAEK